MAAIGLALVAASSAAQAQAISDDIVKIGVLTDMSSLYADATGRGSLAAIKMAVEDYGGRVKGKPVDVVFADHQNRPDLSISIARNWYDNEKVDAIFEVPTSSVALPISTLTREENRNPHQFRRRLFGYHRRRLLAEHGALDWTYDTYALSTVAGSRDRG